MDKSELKPRASYTCPYIKHDSSICGNSCWRPEGCHRHINIYEKNQQKVPCPECGVYTQSITGRCPKHSGRYHSLNFRMRQMTRRIIEANEMSNKHQNNNDNDKKIGFQ